MSLTLSVDGDRWRAHLLATVRELQKRIEHLEESQPHPQP